jgi:hypothetical protein
LSNKGSDLGRAQATADMLVTSPNLPNVQVKTEAELPTAVGTGPAAGKVLKGKETVVAPDEETTEDNFDQPGYRLLIHANGQYYLFRPLKQVPGQPTSNLDIYVIPDARVRRVYIQRGI